LQTDRHDALARLFRFGLREAEDALAVLPTALFLEDLDALETLQDVATGLDLIG